jgi:long-chain acyl-CoA synthetase
VVVERLFGAPDDERPAGDTLGDVVEWLIRREGRSPRADVAVCLSLEERALHAVLKDVSVQARAAPPEEDAPRCHLAVYEHGRPYLSLVCPQGDDLSPRTWVELSSAQVAALETARAGLARQAGVMDAEVDGLVAALPAEGFAELVRHVIDVVDHNDPIELYVDDTRFTNVGRYNNLLPRPGGTPDDQYILSRLERCGPGGATRAERRFLGAMLLLRQANLRAEEFNGRQLTPWALATFFDDKHEQYRRLLEPAGAGEGSECWPVGLAARAACLAQLQQRLQATHRAYRWIDGLTFRKEERWRPRDEEPLTRDLPLVVRAHCAARFGVSADDRGHHDEFFLEVVRKIAQLEPPDARTSALEDLIEVVVRSAMHEVPSPIGMTRGMRDLRHFQDALEEGRYADVCATPIDDGFCAVFARDDARLYEPQPLARVLTTISRRMQFNHRHYLPGHFDAEAVPARPHFYYPPTMSDLAENGEHRHTGHTMARVRYSIRSPAPLRIAGRTWAGLVDIRMMRAVGHPYTVADLVIVDRHTEYLRSIAQAALDLKREGLRAPMVTGFDRAYYERRYPVGASQKPAANIAQAGGHAIGQMLREALRRHGADDALVCAISDRRLTFADVQVVAERLAGAIGGRAGARIAVICGDRLHQALLITAGLAAGHVVCPLDHAMRPRALSALLRHGAPDVIVTDAAAQPLPAPVPGAVLRAEALFAGAAPRATLPVTSAAGLLIYTSGATGAPKGVLLDEAQLAANVAFARDHFGYVAARPWTSGCLLPLHHTFAIVSDLLPVLCAGGRVVILPGFDTGDAGSVAAAFDRHAVRSYSAVPIVLEALLVLRVPLPRSLAFAISGAAPLLERSRARYVQRHGHPVVPCYGLTESVCFATASAIGGGRPDSAGRAAGIEIQIVGEDLQPLRVGERGEIALRGASVVTSYFGDHAGAPDACVEDGWFLTGDMGRLDGDGYLYITGRRKHMLIRGGEKLYLEDLDRCLEEHPAVAEACSVQIPGLFGFERAVTFLVARVPATPGACVTEDALRAHMRERLGPLGVPDELRWTDRIPRSATGKPLRAALRIRHLGAE